MGTIPKDDHSADQPADFTTGQADSGRTVIFFKGQLDKRHIAPLWEKMQTFLAQEDPREITFDFKEVTGFDTAGMALLRRIETHCNEKSGSCERRNLSDSIRHFLGYVSRRSSEENLQQEPDEPGIIARLGRWGRQEKNDGYDVIRFFGDFINTTATALRRPHKIKLSNFFYHLQKVGAEAVPLVFALSGLLGLVIVFQGLRTSNKLGSDIFIADMVAMSVTKQMAPLLTAIIIAGRSGAAFAAEIGSMKIRQELDVLSVMNFDITGFLLLPRIFAMLIATPLLIMIANAAGILGGLVTSLVVLDLSAIRFITEVRNALAPTDIYTGLVKGVGFGLLVGMTGCYHGLKTQNTADSVGVETTSAVVSGILFVILADAIFAIMFSKFGW